MELSLTTPAMLFPAISLLLLAYTSRFLAIAGVIRSLKKDGGQISNLRKRVHIIKHMQGLGAASFFSCVLSMLLLYLGQIHWGEAIFSLSLVLLLGSLLLSLWEIQISVGALEMYLQEMDDEGKDSV